MNISEIKESILDKVRLFLFGDLYKKQEEAIKRLVKENINKREITCDRYSCDDNNNGKCDNIIVALDKDGKCKECLIDFVNLQDDLEESLNIKPKIIITENN